MFAKVHPLSLKVQMLVEDMTDKEDVADMHGTSDASDTSAREKEVDVPGLYAVGPVRGDNFVRFLQVS